MAEGNRELHYSSTARQPDADSVADSDLRVILGEDDNPNQFITSQPKERFRLGVFDVICLVVNRMIGIKLVLQF